MKPIHFLSIILIAVATFGCHEKSAFSEQPKFANPYFFNHNPTYTKNISDLFNDFKISKNDSAKKVFLVEEPIPFKNVGNFLQDSTDLKTFEIQYVKDQSAYLSRINLEKGINKRIVIIPTDTAKKIFQNKNYALFHKTYGDYFLRISHPLFLRDNTYCILYLNYHCDTRCGEELIHFYKKISGKWVLIKMGRGWVS